MLDISRQELARRLDQTNLNAQSTRDDMAAFLQEARDYGFAAAAIMPIWIPLARDILSGSSTTVVAAIGFPLGTTLTQGKVQETRWAIANGPEDIEIDVVINVPMLKSRQYEMVERDLNAVVEAAEGRIVKAIIETPILADDEIVIASMIAERAGAHFVKTSTGFKQFRGWRPSSEEDIRLIRCAIGCRLKVKIAGGVATLDQALKALDAGADRIGTSRGVTIVESLQRYANGI